MERPTSACRVARITLLAGEGSQSRAAYKEAGHGGVYSCGRVRSACGIGGGRGDTDDLSALTIATELSDATRFAAARQVMACTGLVPSEDSSGASQRRGGITKTGNAHLRRILVEAAWHYRHRPAVGTHLRGRHRGASPAAIRCAWAAQHRLHARYRRLIARGKSPPLAATAVARALSAFVWSALTP